MFTNFISRVLGSEKDSVPIRQVDVATPDVIEKSSTPKPIPEKYRKEVALLQSKYGDAFKTGFCINLTLQEALEIMPRERRRIDAYRGLQSYLKRELGITLSITSQKSKSKSL